MTVIQNRVKNNTQGISSKVNHWNNEDNKEDNSLGNQLWEYNKTCPKIWTYGCGGKNNKFVPDPQVDRSSITAFDWSWMKWEIRRIVFHIM